ncbi:hypothetical protein, partial [Mycobacterium avium]|uniref:hypothetical protein n=1 Tax=Mycobacterium avium TaxID=1764 RepID=UPI001F41692C
TCRDGSVRDPGESTVLPPVGRPRGYRKIQLLPPRGDLTDERRQILMNVPISLTKTHLWRRAVRDIRLASRGIAKRMHQGRPIDQGRVRPRHYPPRSCSYLDDDLMSREMHDHVRDEPIRLSSRLAFRLRRS